MGVRKTPTLIVPFGLLVFSLFVGARAGEVPSRLEERHIKKANTAVVGIVEKITGPSFAQHGRGSRTSIAIGTRLFEHDRVITDRSRTHTRYKDGTYVELGEESSFEVERVRFNPRNPIPQDKAGNQFDESVFRFLYGVARITAPDVHENEFFTVKTANAVLRITGPADFYLVQLVGERDLTVRVAKGRVELLNAVTNERMHVPEGMAAYLKVTGSVSSAGTFTADQLDFLKSRTRI